GRLTTMSDSFGSTVYRNERHGTVTGRTHVGKSEACFAPLPVNWALASNGGVASASSTYGAGYPIASVNDGEINGVGWGAGSGGWSDGTSGAFPDWAQISFAGAKTIDTVVVYTMQDNYNSPAKIGSTLACPTRRSSDLAVWPVRRRPTARVIPSRASMTAKSTAWVGAQARADGRMAPPAPFPTGRKSVSRAQRPSIPSSYTPCRTTTIRPP